MDGNGRWATERGFGRTWGHREGAKRVDEIVTECCRLGISYLTLYAFSTENWNRPSHEVTMLMRLLVHHLKAMDKKLLRNKVRLVAQGTLNQLPPYAQRELARVIRTTEIPEPKLNLNLSLSYGGRQEIVDGVRRVAQKVLSGDVKISDINESTFREYLYQPLFPDPDILIRTGGEYRVSNFMLWEIAYTELVVTNVFWPEFGVTAFHETLENYAKRQRRYGKTNEQIVCEKQC
ncbi:MAG: di-trans,poly-cis-decaprenylcistransferase [Deltaproteobacteria bacterium]|nr:di-trans,poly-cis-decaprenylcistransferase [Deltaproteobacteria bacterium]